MKIYWNRKWTEISEKDLYTFIVKVYPNHVWPEEIDDLVNEVKEFDPEGLKISFLKGE